MKHLLSKPILERAKRQTVGDPQCIGCNLQDDARCRDLARLMAVLRRSQACSNSVKQASISLARQNYLPRCRPILAHPAKAMVHIYIYIYMYDFPVCVPRFGASTVDSHARKQHKDLFFESGDWRGGEGLPREGVVVEELVPSFESNFSLGVEGGKSGMSRNFARMFGTPGVFKTPSRPV